MFKKGFIILLSLLMVSCSHAADPKSRQESTEPVKQEDQIIYTGQIYLYGEEHGVEAIIEKEYDIWYDYYHNKGMRHLFIESSYAGAGFLNLWMAADNDDILDQLFIDKTQTSASNDLYKSFYKKIKAECPETIFHGTDVDHLYNTTGQRYLDYLESQNLMDSVQYKTTLEVMEQGELFSNSRSSVYRENKMVENFIRELEGLNDQAIMGIYGAAHTGIDKLTYDGKVESMANQLDKLYPGQIESTDLMRLAKDIPPERIDHIEVEGKTYKAGYYGKHEIDWTKDYQCREFWILEDAYDDFRDYQLQENVLPDSNYPMIIEAGQVIVIDYTLPDGSIDRQFHRIDGYSWKDMLISNQIAFNKIEKLSDPLSEDIVTIKDKTYTCSYFGKHTFDESYKYKEVTFWRVEDAYEDLKDLQAKEFAYLIENIPFQLEQGMVVMFDVTLHDGKQLRFVARHDGPLEEGDFYLLGFSIKE